MRTNLRSLFGAVALVCVSFSGSAQDKGRSPQLPDVSLNAKDNLELNSRDRQLTKGFSEGYRNRGALGMPSYEFEIPVIFDSDNGVSPAIQACIYLHRIFHDAHGQDYRECRAVEDITMPKGKFLAKSTGKTSMVGTTSDLHTHMFTPARLGKDKLRFMLDIGAAKKIDVVVIFNATRFEP